MFLLVSRKEFESLKERVKQLESEVKLSRIERGKPYTFPGFTIKTVKLKDIVLKILNHLDLNWKIKQASEEVVLEPKQSISVRDNRKSKEN